MGAVNLDIPCFSLLLLVAFADEKAIEKYWNIKVRIRVKQGLQKIGSWFNIYNGTILRWYYDSIDLVCRFKEQLKYYCESTNQDFFLDPIKKYWPMKRPTEKILDLNKKDDSCKSIFDPRNPRKKIFSTT